MELGIANVDASNTCMWIKPHQYHQSRVRSGPLLSCDHFFLKMRRGLSDELIHLTILQDHELSFPLLIRGTLIRSELDLVGLPEDSSLPSFINCSNAHHQNNCKIEEFEQLVQALIAGCHDDIHQTLASDPSSATHDDLLGRHGLTEIFAKLSMCSAGKCCVDCNLACDSWNNTRSPRGTVLAVAWTAYAWHQGSCRSWLHGCR